MEARNVLLTGASRGLGLALARELARRGDHVVGVARGPEIEAAMAEIRRDPAVRAGGGTAHAVRGDVADPAAAARIVGEAAALVGPIDVLVQNASTLGPIPLRPLSELDPAGLVGVFEANLFGPFRLARALVGGMVLRGRGTILAISSDAAVSAYPTWGAYGASKAALDHLHRVLAAELEGAGVTVTIVDPGEMDTRMHADALPDADPATLARPADVARRIADLLADAPHGARVLA